MSGQQENIDDMTTMVSITGTALKRGYTENFQVKEEGLFAPTTKIHYLPNEVTIDNFYRFEGASDPQDNAILYLLQTHDGIQGMLVDSYGANSDVLINNFIKEVEEIHKTRAEGL